MKKLTCHFVVLTLALLIIATPSTDAQEKLTIAWAQWDPANYLDELSKDFTAETGIEVDLVQISWSHFQDQVFTAFVGKSDRYDIVIGDSQWLGRNSVGGHYVDLTDWINENIDVDSIYATAEYDGITMGFQQVMWSYGGSYGDPETYKVDGHINSDDVLKALEYYKSLKEFSPPDAPNYYWAETLDAFKAGKVAMAMDYFAFFPGVVDSTQNPNYYDKTGFFVSPAGPKGHAISIGGQGMSISAYSKNQEIAKRYMKWFMQKPVQEKWAQLGGFTPHEEVLQSEVFLNATPFNKAFAASFPYLRDFWAVPEYAELLEACQTGWNQVIIGSKSAKEALDEIARKHEAIFEDAGYYD